MNVERTIGPEGWEDFRGATGLRDRKVISQIIGRVIRCADCLNAEALKDAPNAKVIRGELRIAVIPYPRGMRFVEQHIHAEVSLQLKVSPVIERIAQRVRHSARVSQEFFIRCGIARAEGFAYSIRPHCTPFVVIAFEPDLK